MKTLFLKYIVIVLKYFFTKGFGDDATTFADPILSLLTEDHPKRLATAIDSGQYAQFVSPIIEHISSILTELRATPDDIEVVTLELAATLGVAKITLASLLAESLDARMLTFQLRTARDVTGLQLSDSQLALYERSLPTIAEQIVHLAPQMKNWTSLNAREVLRRLGPSISQQPPIYAEPIQTPSSPLPEPRSSALIKLESRIDTGKELIKTGLCQSALELLEDIRKSDDYTIATNHLKFRIAANIGTCALELHDVATAVDEFQRAYRFQPDNPNAHYFKSYASLLSGEITEAEAAARTGLIKTPGDANLTSLLIQSLFEQGRLKEIETMLRTDLWITNEAACCLTLGDGFARMGQLDKAEHYFELGIALSPEMYKGLLAYGSILMMRAQREMQADMPLPSRIPPIVVDRQNKAIDAFTRTMELTEQHQDRSLFYEALINRAAAFISQGEYKEAQRDLGRVLYEQPDNMMALLNMGITYYGQHKLDEAIPFLQRAADSGASPEANLFLGNSLISQKEFEQARLILVAVWTPNEFTPLQVEIADALLEAYEGIQDEQSIRELIGVLSSPRFDVAESHAALSQHFVRSGKIPEAIQELQTAIEKAQPQSKERMTYLLAGLFAKQGDHTNSLARLESIVDLALPGTTRNNYVTELYRGGNYSKALSIARRIRDSEGALPVISEIEALTLQIADDWSGASKIWGIVAEVTPNNPTCRVNAAAAAIEAGNREEARVLINKVDISEITNSPSELLNVAYIRAVCGLGGALPFAYAARRQAGNDPEMHARYVMLCTSLPEPEAELGVHPPETVEPGTAIDLTLKDKIVRLAILEDDPLQPGELSPSDQTAITLLGKSIGDLVRLPTGLLGEDDFEITQIHTKYAHMVHESMNSFGKQRLNHIAVSVQDVNEPEFQQRLIDSLDDKARRSDQLVTAYRTTPVMLYTVAEVMHRPVIEVWQGLTSLPNGRVMCSPGQPQDSADQAAAASTCKQVVLDEVGLLTIVSLGIQTHLACRFDRLIVPGCVSEALKSYCLEKSMRQPNATMWSDWSCPELVYTKLS
jgi:tetratricopeptide (TPR) repeat protein